MNFKKITALALALLLGISGTTSNVFAADKPPLTPVISSGTPLKMEKDVQTTPTILGKEEEKEIKSVFEEILNGNVNSASLQDTERYEKVSTFENVLKLFAEQRQYEVYNTLYKEIIDNYCNTDFYTTNNKQENFEQQIGNIESRVEQISASIPQLEKNFSEYNNNLNTYKNKIEKKHFVLDDIYDYYKNSHEMSNIGKILKESYNKLDEFQKETKSLQKQQSSTYSNLLSKYNNSLSTCSTKQSKNIYSYIHTIIDTQNKKYDLQIKALLTNISQTQKIILNFTNKHVATAIDKNSSFTADNQFMNEVNKLKKENDDKSEEILFLQNHIIYMQKIRDELYRLKSDVERKIVQSITHPAGSNYFIYNISPISQFLYSSETTSNDPSRIQNQNLIGTEISQIFKDNEFAKLIYEDILNHEDFNSDYKLDYFDVYMIEHSSIILFLGNEKNINSLEGIEYFIRLKYLFCHTDRLDNIDLSKNKSLKILDLSESRLTSCSLDLSENTNLETINCYKCEITTIQLPKTDTIKSINLSSNNLLEKLDLSSFKNLQKVNLSSNYLPGLIIANENTITELDISRNDNFGDFDFNKLSNLKRLDCSHTNRKSLLIDNLKNLESLNFSFNKEIKNVNISNCTKLEALNCASCCLEEIDLLPLTSLKAVNCSYNNLKTLKIASKEIIQVFYNKNPHLEKIYFLKEAFIKGIKRDDNDTGNCTSQRAKILYLKEDDTVIKK